MPIRRKSSLLRFQKLPKDIESVQPAFEFIFSATEEAIYVHTIISTKNVRGLTNNDLERALKHSSSQSNQEGFSGHHIYILFFM
ncbi:hypothetical protein ZOSMA_936G00010 [Zostera marina]|uniref:Uncharacterized protein n=1 Tax=Zostera marina TaxID=29655 RepID=A0A0K9NKQ5_ZOSMR|nr:hypothetical protein ZOSMA_936G00010 [Zostera marina]